MQRRRTRTPPGIIARSPTLWRRVAGLVPLVCAGGLAAGCVNGEIGPRIDLGRGQGGQVGGQGGQGGNSTGPVSLPPATICAPFAGETTRKAYTPKLFARGDDPSRDAECTGVTNPERGFFLFRDLRRLRDSDLPRDKNPLVYGKVVLADYRERALDDRLIAEMNAGFAVVRKAGYKVLPRFYYADEAGAPLATTDRVLEHIGQLKSLLRDNADVIAALHAGFLGFWGEWHADVRIPAADRKRVLDALIDAVPATRMVLVRRPSFKRDAFGGPLTEALAFAGTPLARLGHVNDCFLASDTDEGTYADEAERRYAIADSTFTPVGGETCAVNPPRSDCPSALSELERHHWSFVNAEYSREVIARWQEAGCAPTIACRLGYRFVIRGFEAPRTVKAGGELQVTLDLNNDGYARPFNPRPVHLVLSGPKIVSLTTGTDARAWAPTSGVAEGRVCVVARVPGDLPAGTYQLGVALPDASPSLAQDARYSVRFIGGATWDGRTGVNLLDASVAVE
jgi:hypothetical protein